MLSNEGDFLLRKTEIQGSIVLALAVKWDKKVKHFVVNHSEKSTFYFETHHEKSVNELVDWHMKTKTPVSSVSGAILKKSVDRPAWVLNHDCIKTIRKLGEGAFGEVFMAELTTEKGIAPVAVKTMREEISREARLKFMKEARIHEVLAKEYKSTYGEKEEKEEKRDDRSEKDLTKKERRKQKQS
uniref:Tyrosine-protein kinase n=1 Tax=Panagrolaimus sp. JU765 TaxID=591449 RepID=A0AC34RJ41_9BILA